MNGFLFFPCALVSGFYGFEFSVMFSMSLSMLYKSQIPPGGFGSFLVYSVDIFSRLRSGRRVMEGLAGHDRYESVLPVHGFILAVL